MISPGYKLNASDIKKLMELKNSMVYGTYLKAIANSPAYNGIMNEHIKKINISPDINKLKKQGKVPDTLDTKAINDIFKFSLMKMAMGITADAIILKEMEDVNVEELLDGLRKDADLAYPLGMSDEKYYKQAARMLEEGKLDNASLEYRGLIEYMKIHGDQQIEYNDEPIDVKETITEESKTTSSSKWDNIDLSNDNIKL